MHFLIFGEEEKNGGYYWYIVYTRVELDGGWCGGVEGLEVDALSDLLCAQDEDDPGGEGAEQNKVEAADRYHVSHHLRSSFVTTVVQSFNCSVVQSFSPTVVHSIFLTVIHQLIHSSIGLFIALSSRKSCITVKINKLVNLNIQYHRKSHLSHGNYSVL